MIRVHGLDVEPIIGLEIHVQLATRTKLFCGCPVEFGAPPNARVCPVCLGLPGALPRINRRAVELAVRAALALNCQIAELTKWDRKNYFYPDLPKNYQISQYDLPLATRGRFEFPLDGRTCRVRIIRAHLEEDAGKTVHHFPGFSGIDLNRAGTPLLEVVSEPDLHSADEVREFAVQLHRLVGYLGVSEGNMQRGQMRFEPNINLRIVGGGQEFRTPIVEVKNLNSFRSLYGAVQYEIQRQAEEWQQSGETAAPGNKRNRGWDDVAEVTVPQREKEEAHDYRYFPEPDLPPLTLDRAWVSALQETLPELPAARAARYIREFHVPAQDAVALVDDRASADLLDGAADAGGDKPLLGRHFLGFWARHAHERGTTVAGLSIPAPQLAELANLVCDGRINATAAARIAEKMVDAPAAPGSGLGVQDSGLGVPGPELGVPATGLGLGVARRFSGGGHELTGSEACGAVPVGIPSPTKLAEELGLLQSRDEDQIAAWVDQVFAANQQAVRDALANPKKLNAARGFLTGQVMRLSGGKADPKIVGALVEKRLDDLART